MAFAVEFAAMCGFLPGFCDHEMSIGVIVRRFKDAFVQVMARNGVTSQHHVCIQRMKTVTQIRCWYGLSEFLAILPP